MPLSKCVKPSQQRRSIYIISVAAFFIHHICELSLDDALTFRTVHILRQFLNKAQSQRLFFILLLGQRSRYVLHGWLMLSLWGGHLLCRLKMTDWRDILSCWWWQESRRRVLFDVERIGRVDNFGLWLTGRDGGRGDRVLIVGDSGRRDRIIGMVWLDNRLGLLIERKLSRFLFQPLIELYHQITLIHLFQIQLHLLIISSRQGAITAQVMVESLKDDIEFILEVLGLLCL